MSHFWVCRSTGSHFGKTFTFSDVRNKYFFLLYLMYCILLNYVMHHLGFYQITSQLTFKWLCRRAASRILIVPIMEAIPWETITIFICFGTCCDFDKAFAFSIGIETAVYKSLTGARLPTVQKWTRAHHGSWSGWEQWRGQDWTPTWPSRKQRYGAASHHT